MKEKLPYDTLCYHLDGGKVSLVIDWCPWLQAELNPIYAKEIEKLRARGRTVVQMRNFHGDGGLVAVRHLFSMALNVAIEHGATDIISACAPRSARGYRAFGFVDMLPDDGPHPWDLARDVDGDLLPTRLIRLAIDGIPPARLTEWLAVQSTQL